MASPNVPDIIASTRPITHTSGSLPEVAYFHRTDQNDVTSGHSPATSGHCYTDSRSRYGQHHNHPQPSTRRAVSSKHLPGGADSPTQSSRDVNSGFQTSPHVHCCYQCGPLSALRLLPGHLSDDHHHHRLPFPRESNQSPVVATHPHPPPPHLPTTPSMNCCSSPHTLTRSQSQPQVTDTTRPGFGPSRGTFCRSGSDPLLVASTFNSLTGSLRQDGSQPIAQQVDPEVTRDIIRMLRVIGDDLDTKIRHNHVPGPLNLLDLLGLTASDLMVGTLKQLNLVGMALLASLELLKILRD